MTKSEDKRLAVQAAPERPPLEQFATYDTPENEYIPSGTALHIRCAQAARYALHLEARLREQEEARAALHHALYVCDGPLRRYRNSFTPEERADMSEAGKRLLALGIEPWEPR